MFATLPGDADDPTFSKDFYVFGNGLPVTSKLSATPFGLKFDGY